MVKTGLKNNFSDILNNIEILENKNKESRLGKQTENEYKKLSAKLLELGQNKNIVEILKLERAIINSKLAKNMEGDISQSTKTSLLNDIQELDKASNVLTMLVADKNAYKEVTNILISDRAIDRNRDGTPRDSFHRFISSHTTQLNNRIRSSDPSTMKRVSLIHSKKNMEICKNEYKKLQAIALDIKLPEKSKERER